MNEIELTHLILNDGKVVDGLGAEDLPSLDVVHELVELESEDAGNHPRVVAGAGFPLPCRFTTSG